MGVWAWAVTAHTCNDCDGAGGETKTSGNTETWRECTTCGGSGQR